MLDLIPRLYSEQAERLFMLVSAASQVGTSNKLREFALADRTWLGAMETFDDRINEAEVVELCETFFRQVSVRNAGLLEAVPLTKSTRQALQHRLWAGKAKTTQDRNILAEFSKGYTINFIHKTAHDF